MSTNYITRIKNNQITDATILANVKIAPQSITGGLFNPDVTINSNITILGNLAVSGNTSTINSVNTYIQDPIVTFNSGYVGSMPAGYEIGMLINRNLTSLGPYGAVNTAWIWNETDAAFEAIATATTGNAISTLTSAGWANVNLGNLQAYSINITPGTLTASAGIVNTPISGSTGYFTTAQATNFSSANVLITGGNIFNTPISGNTGYFTTFNAANLSTANALISGGNITSFSSINTNYAVVVTGFSTANAVITGGYAQNLANVTTSLAYVANLNSTSGNVVTLYATNFSTANAQITGASTNIGLGSIIGNVYSNNGYFANLSSANILLGNVNVTGTLYAANANTPNIVISGGYITNMANANIGTMNANLFYAGNLSTANARITGTTTFIGTGTTPIANIYVSTLYAGNLSTPNALITSETVTTGTTTNFSTGNAQITGATTFIGTGATPIANAYITTAYATNFSTPNSVVVNESVGTGVVTNFSTGNAQITGATSTFGTGATLAASVYVSTLYATNSAAANAIIAKGYADNFIIGANAAASGTFTTLTASGVTQITATTPSTNSTTGALVVSGGVGVAGNVNIAGNLSVNGTLTYINTTQEIVSGIEVVAGNLVANSGVASTSANTGAVVVSGGVGVSGNIYSAGGIQGTPIGNAVASSGTFNSLTVNGPSFYNGNLVAESGTASSNTTTGALVVAGSGGLGVGGKVNIGGQTIISDTTPNNGASTGAFQVTQGGAYISGNLFVGGNINISTSTINSITGNNAQFFGNAAGFGAIYAGIATNYVYQPQTVLQNSTNFNGYAQVNHQNISNGSSASTDYVATADTGTAGAGYIDMGINSSGFVGGAGNELNYALDGYLYVTGTTSSNGNLLLGTSSATDVVISTNGFGTVNQNTRFKNGVGVIIYPTTTSANLTSGALQVAGGVGIQGNLYANQANIGNMFFSQSGSIYNDQASGNQIFQTSTNNLANGIGIGNESGANSIVYSSGGIVFKTGATLHAAAIPTAGVNNVTIDAGGNLLITTTTASTNSGTGALQVFGGAGIGGNLYVNNNLTAPYAFITTQANITAVQAQAIGNVAPGTGVFTTLKSTGVFTSQGNIVATSSTQSTSITTGAIVVPNGGIGVSGTSYFGSTLTVNSGVYALGAFTGAVTSGIILDYNSGTGRISLGTNTDGFAIYNNGLAGTALFELDKTGNATVTNSAFINAVNDSYSTTTGALQVAGGVGIVANLYVGGQTFAEGNVQMQQAVTINSQKNANYNFIVNGHNDNTLIWARPGNTYDQVLIGNSATPSTLVGGAKLIINSSDSVLLPVGSTTQRPGATGGTDTAGMLRYSTTTSTLEYFNGTVWKVPGQEFTIVQFQSFNGDGTTVAFQLTGIPSGSAGLTTAGTLVGVNGVLQIPVTSYSTFSSNNTVVFTEAPAVGDMIDVRTLTTTVDPQYISDTSGYNTIVANSAGIVVSTGSGPSSPVVSWIPGGAQVNLNANVTVPTNGSATAIDSFAFSNYASAEYTVTATVRNTNVRSISKVLVVTDGTTVYTTLLGNVCTTSNSLVSLSGTVSTGTVTINATVTNPNTILRINKLYQPI